MDPLSVAAGIAGLASFGIQVADSLIQFYTSYKSQDTYVAQTIQNLETLLATLQSLDTARQNRAFQLKEQDLLKKIDLSLTSCRQKIQELRDECEKFEQDSTQSIKGTISIAGRRITYPFRQSTLQKLGEDIGEIRNSLSLALEVLQLKDHEQNHDDVVELKSLLEVVRASQISSTVRDWLRAPDASVNHDAACAKRCPGTGTWLVNGPTFAAWLQQDNSFLWLKGFAGCGKSVICSTAIQYSFRRKQHDPRVGIAFFYFTFNDDSKQDESAMLRALLLQLSNQFLDSYVDLTRLYDSNRTAVPPPAVLIGHLRSLIQKFDQVYILLDALDESPRYGPREQVLEAIKNMREWLWPGLHLLVTSRDETNIHEFLNCTNGEEIDMKNIQIDQDIQNFISRQLSTDRNLRKWNKHHERIQNTLAQKAKGV